MEKLLFMKLSLRVKPSAGKIGVKMVVRVTKTAYEWRY